MRFYFKTQKKYEPGSNCLYWTVPGIEIKTVKSKNNDACNCKALSRKERVERIMPISWKIRMAPRSQIAGRSKTERLDQTIGY